MKSAIITTLLIIMGISIHAQNPLVIPPALTGTTSSGVNTDCAWDFTYEYTINKHTNICITKS